MRARHMACILHLVLIAGVSIDAAAQTSGVPSSTSLIGVNAQQSPQGLVVKSLISNSAAVGHLRRGDVLRFLSADGHPVYSIQSFNDIAKAKSAIGKDAPATLEIMRNGQPKYFTITFSPSGTTLSPLASKPDVNSTAKTRDGNAGSPPDAVPSAEDSQEPLSATQGSPMAYPALRLDRLVVATIVKSTNGIEQVSILKPRWEGEIRTRTVMKYVPVTEERERKVTDPKSGEVRVERYSETVLHSVPEEQQYEVIFPAKGTDRSDVPLDKVTAWTIDGQPLSIDQLRPALSSPKRVFILPDLKEYQFDPYFVATLDKNVIVMRPPENLGKLPAITWPQPTAAPQSPMPAPVAALPYDEATLAAWVKAGAQVGWVGMDEYDSIVFRTQPDGLTALVQGFGFAEWQENLLAELLDPGVPFGLDLGYRQVTDAGLKELAGLTSLQTLNLRSTPVTDVGLKELAGLTSLQTLSLDTTKLTDVGLKELAGLTNLQTLSIGGTQLTDVGLKELAGLTSLQNLSLHSLPVTDAGLKELAGLTGLQTLSLGGTQVTDAGLKELAGLKSLRNLSLYSTQVTDAGLKELAGFTSLQKLNLYGLQVSDAGLQELAGHKSLQTLDLRDTQVTEAGFAAVRSTLPAYQEITPAAPGVPALPAAPAAPALPAEPAPNASSPFSAAEQETPEALASRRQLTEADTAIVIGHSPDRLKLIVTLGAIEAWSLDDFLKKVENDGPISMGPDDSLMALQDGQRILIKKPFLQNSAALFITNGKVQFFRADAIQHPDGSTEYSQTPALVREASFPEFTMDFIAKSKVLDQITDRKILQRLRDFICGEGEFATLEKPEGGGPISPAESQDEGSQAAPAAPAPAAPAQ